ncbi:MAG: hypothetical protein FWG04_02825 [Desulfovibrionaceae bacterium]|nr:hypothetical protein [Desulfovibrionaceae bacterium]
MAPLPSLHIAKASPAWGLILQSGAVISCSVGVPLTTLLYGELGLREEQLQPVDVLLLDGMPVDDPEKAVVPDGARLALAAGVPGIVGLAMKSGSAVRALRSGITHTGGEAVNPRPGTILLSLYSLAIPLLAGYFLRRGIMVEAAQVLRYARFAPEDRCLFDRAPITARNLPQAFAHMPGSAFLLLTIDELCRK